MKIAILGCGNLGSTLGAIWNEAGHEVLFASGDPDKARRIAQRHHAQHASYAEAVQHSQVLLYTLRGVAPKGVYSGRWSGKTVIDCTLPELPLGFQFTPRPRSLAQELAEEIPLCQVVKAFCLHPVELYHHGPEQLREWGVQSFYCGDSPDDKKRVGQLAQDLGLLPFDCGGLNRAYLLENQGDFWRLFQMQQGQALVSQFQLVGYPEPQNFQRQTSFDRLDASDPRWLPIRGTEEEAPPE